MGEPKHADETSTPPLKHEETYYDILKVSRNATISQIVAAYHTARNAFSSDSVATYSLFSHAETEEILQKLDEAYQTLSNIEKKREYDQYLDLKEKHGDIPASLSQLELKQRAVLHGTSSAPKSEDKAEPVRFTPLTTPYDGYVSGGVLKEIRERRGMTVEEVAKTTKIPARYIHALEANNTTALPARVYMQGFVKNLANLYNLDPILVMKSYLDYTDQKNETPESE